jgi:hypothetical protein
MGKRARKSNQVIAELRSKIIHFSATALLGRASFLSPLVPENEGASNEKLKKTPPDWLAGSGNQA